jgi:peptidoglycan hydrolase CwlO-like protein
MFLLSSKNFQQAYKRLQYMKQYTSFRKIQGEEIKGKSKELVVYNQKLDVQKSAKQKLIDEKEKERLSLEQEKKEQEKLVNAIKKDKNKIANDIKKKQQEARAIDKQIDTALQPTETETFSNDKDFSRSKTLKDILLKASGPDMFGMVTIESDKPLRTLEGYEIDILGDIN